MGSSPMITNFTAGMLSPRLQGRVDLAKYYNGAELLRNIIVFPFGSATRRPGTEYVATAACSTYPPKMFPFKFSETQAYSLEFGQDTASGSTPGYVRIFYKGTPLDGTGKQEFVGNPYMTAGTAGWTFGAHWAYDGTYNYLVKSTGGADAATTTLNGLNPATATYAFNMKMVSCSGGTLTVLAGAATVTQITSPGLTYATFTWAAGAATAVLSLSGSSGLECEATNVSLRLYSDPMILDSPYTAAELKDLRIAQQADVVYITHPDHLPYKLSRYGHRAWNLATFNITSPPPEWSAGRGYPRAVAFYEQRLWYAGTETYPQTVWASVTGLFDSFDTSGATATRSLSYEIGSSDTVDRIRWLLPHKQLIIGTEGSEWSCGVASSLNPIASDNIKFQRESSYGTVGSKAQLIGNNVVFIGKMGKSLNAFKYDYSSYGYRADNLALLNDFILGAGLVDFGYQQQPASLIWCLTTANELLSCTYYSTEQVVAWCDHTTMGTFESFTIIPGDNGNDELWVSCLRTTYTSGGTAVQKRYIERMSVTGTEELGATEAYYVDCGGRYTAATVGIVSLATTHYSVGATSVPAIMVKTASAHSLVTGDYFKFFALDTATELNNTTHGIRSYSDATNFICYGTIATNYTLTAGYLRERSNSITGLTWLQGRSVVINGDGAALPEQTVTSSGTVGLSERISDGILGLPYTSYVKSLRIEIAGGKGGVSQAHKKRMSECVVRFYKTIGAKCGISTATTNLQIIPFRNTNDPMDTPIPLFSGDMLVRVPTGFNREGRVCVVQDQPLPMTILGIIQDVEVGDI